MIVNTANGIKPALSIISVFEKNPNIDLIVKSMDYP